MWIFFSLTWSDQVTPWKSIYDRDPQNHIWMNHLDLDTPSRIWLKLFMTWTHQVTSEIMNYSLHNHMWNPPSHTSKAYFLQGPQESYLNELQIVYDMDPPSHIWKKLFMTWTHQVTSEIIHYHLETWYVKKSDLDPPSHMWIRLFDLDPPSCT